MSKQTNTSSAPKYAAKQSPVSTRVVRNDDDEGDDAHHHRQQQPPALTSQRANAQHNSNSAVRSISPTPPKNLPSDYHRNAVNSHRSPQRQSFVAQPSEPQPNAPAVPLSTLDASREEDDTESSSSDGDEEIREPQQACPLSVIENANWKGNDAEEEEDPLSSPPVSGDAHVSTTRSLADADDRSSAFESVRTLSRTGSLMMTHQHNVNQSAPELRGPLSPNQQSNSSTPKHHHQQHHHRKHHHLGARDDDDTSSVSSTDTGHFDDMTSSSSSDDDNDHHTLSQTSSQSSEQRTALHAAGMASLPVKRLNDDALAQSMPLTQPVYRPNTAGRSGAGGQRPTNDSTLITPSWQRAPSTPNAATAQSRLSQHTSNSSRPGSAGVIGLAPHAQNSTYSGPQQSSSAAATMGTFSVKAPVVCSTNFTVTRCTKTYCGGGTPLPIPRPAEQNRPATSGSTRKGAPVRGTQPLTQFSMGPIPLHKKSFLDGAFEVVEEQSTASRPVGSSATGDDASPPPNRSSMDVEEKEQERPEGISPDSRRSPAVKSKTPLVDDDDDDGNTSQMSTSSAGGDTQVTSSPSSARTPGSGRAAAGVSFSQAYRRSVESFSKLSKSDMGSASTSSGGKEASTKPSSSSSKAPSTTNDDHTIKRKR